MTLHEFWVLGAAVPRSWRAVADIIGILVIIAIAFMA